MTGRITHVPPISPMLAAALEAGLTRWLVIPATAECPKNCAKVTLPPHQFRHLKASLNTPDPWNPNNMTWPMVPLCSTCGDRGQVPVEVNAGDTLTAPITGEPPEMGWLHRDGTITNRQRFDGDIGAVGPEGVTVMPATHHWDDHGEYKGVSIESTTYPLRPGGSLTATVAAPAIPIIESGDMPSASAVPVDESVCYIVGTPVLTPSLGGLRCIRDYRDRSGYGSQIEDMVPDAAWQDFPPGMQAVLVDNVTVTTMTTAPVCSHPRTCPEPDRPQFCAACTPPKGPHMSDNPQQTARYPVEGFTVERAEGRWPFAVRYPSGAVVDHFDASELTTRGIPLPPEQRTARTGRLGLDEVDTRAWAKRALDGRPGLEQRSHDASVAMCREDVDEWDKRPEPDTLTVTLPIASVRYAAARREHFLDGDDVPITLVCRAALDEAGLADRVDTAGPT